MINPNIYWDVVGCIIIGYVESIAFLFGNTYSENKKALK
jgi:hypothetical protein